MLYSFLRDTVRFFRHHWIPLVSISAGLSLLFGILALGVQSLVTSAIGGALFAPLLQWLGGLIINCALVLYLGSALANQYLPPILAIQRGLKFLLRLGALQFLLVAIASIGLLPLALINGFLAMVVGVPILLYLGARLTLLSSFYLLLEGESIASSINSAWKASGGYSWTLIGGHLLFLAITVPFTFVLNSENTNAVASLLYSVVTVPFSVMLYIFCFRVYSDSRQSS